MINLLPTGEKKIIRQEYIVNNVIIANTLLLTLFLVADVLIGSLLIVSYVDNNAIEGVLEAVSVRNVEERREYSKVINELNRKLSILSTNKTESDPVQVIKEIIEVKSGGIKIKRITYDASREEGVEADTISFFGIARARDDLISFQNRLRQLKTFEITDTPVSTLASGSNINFSINLNLLK